MESKVILFNEKELIHRIKEGDVVAFELVYRHYAQRLAIKLLQLLKSEELAQDILQDVFLKVWEIRDRLDPELSFGAFLYTIAGNLSKNTFQKSLQLQIYHQRTSFEETHSPIDALMDQKDAAFALNEAMERLTPRQKEIYTLHKIDGYSYVEISERLGISTHTINHLMQQANKQLKTVLMTHSLLLAAILLS